MCNVAEEVSLADLLADVEELLGGSLARHGIEVVRDYRQTPLVNSDRQKLLQVLLNVLRNAMDAIKQAHNTGLGRLNYASVRGTQGRCSSRLRTMVSEFRRTI